MKVRAKQLLTSHPKFLTACALAVVFAACPAIAQDNVRSNETTVIYQNGDRESVEVTAPRYHGKRSAIGAEIRDVSLSREVRFDDLDLRSPEGARVLRARIRYTANALCAKLDLRFPVTAEDSPPCYRTAVDQAMYRADEAISDARASTY